MAPGDPECRGCKNAPRWEYIGAGLRSCMECGVLTTGVFEEFDSWSSNEQINRSCYTRLKRFRKYLHRACHLQSSCSVPDETWQYLLERGPYHSAGHIVKTLKAAGKTIKRKCYDSLPLMVHKLCMLAVPSLDAIEIRKAIEHFSVIDRHFRNGPFVSYLFVLEYILHKIGRPDICPFTSRIQCRKRRAKYNELLDGIFGTECRVPPILV